MEGETELTKGRRPRVDPSLGVRQVRSWYPSFPRSQWMDVSFPAPFTWPFYLGSLGRCY
jgi:hypothetical protein